MKYKKIMLILITAIFLASIAGVSASDANDTAVANKDTSQIGLSDSNKVIEDNLQTSEENDELTLTDNDVLGAVSAKYSDLNREIRASGNVTLTHKNYIYDDDATAITITEDNKVIDGNGAVIYMEGSTIRAFDVIANGVTIKNLTIKNANYWENGSAIKFAGDSGTVINCNFINNTAQNGGAIYFDKTGNVENCNFTNNKATGDDSYGGAVYFNHDGTVSNCNFSANTATYGDGGAVYFNSNGSVTNCNFTDNEAFQGGAVYFCDEGTVTNCNFTNNQASVNGGAVYFQNTGNVTNCNFTNNSAGYGGAIRMTSGSIENCNFVNNTASEWGGAIRFSGTGTVTNCNFIDNQATGSDSEGGAIMFSGSGTVTNCNFTDNSASYGGAIFSNNWYTAADTCIFKRNSGDNVNVVIYPPTLNVDNFTTFYGSGEKLTFNLTTNSGMPVTNGNISISVYFKDNNSWVRNYSCLSSEGWIPDLLVGSYYAIFDTEYAGFQAINRTITINKAKTELAAKAVTVTYNSNKKMVITLTDINGKPLSGLKLTVKIKSDKTYTTDANGQIKINVANLVPNTYTVKITFNGDANYDMSSKDVKVTVTKATPKLTAKAKSFKKSVKTKKYTVTLKDNNGKAMKKVKLTLKVKGKTYKAKTNAKGKATFKIKNLKKKGIYKATVTFKGDKYYNKVTKKVKITVK